MLDAEKSLHTDTSFITNEDGHTLYERFSVLLGKNTRWFDCLVGYFFISGFYRLYPALEAVERIRILVGLKTDAEVFARIQQARAEGELELVSHAAVREPVTTLVLGELEAADDRLDVEQGVLRFVEWLRSGKLEIRAVAGGHLHAKVYIMTFHPDDRDKGRVITGSSNFSRSGLQDNLEFNVELKDPRDFDFAVRKFNKLWDSAVDVSAPYVDTVVNRSPYAMFTPYELYLKFLYEYFKPELNQATISDELFVPKGFKRLKYQEEAVLNARKVLEEYGGVFLADVVGLGKTYMAALLAQQLSGRHLVIAPPHLLDDGKRGSWPSVFGDFQVRQARFQSIGKLEELLQTDLDRFENVFIDESHRFRTEDTRSYEMLAEICRGKRVILVSATPLNNSPKDILSQIKLFQAGKAANIPNLRNLEAFFAGLEARMKGLDRKDDAEAYLQAIATNARETRERLLKYLMVRRTRSEIERYYGGDMRQQGMAFPAVQDPIPLFYRLNRRENEVFSETLRLLTTELSFTRYTPLLYYREKIDQRERQGQRNLATFMKILMVKRLESSFFAFRQTLNRFMTSYGRMIKEFRNGNVYISKKHGNKIFELLEIGDVEGIENLLEADKAERLSSADFMPEFLAGLEADAATLARIHELWTAIDRDPKWETFRAVLQQQGELRTSKLIVFTESVETAEYLAGRIRADVEPRTLLFAGGSGASGHRDVIANFDANAYTPSDDYRILICTDVLAEGVNLHRSNVVITYDLPWNPTRLIQRVGRVNRVDTRFTEIHTYNFFPSEEGNDAIKLREAAESKIQAFIEMLGADARLLTEGEEVKSFDLFARLNSRKTLTGEDEDEESELEYLTEIRHIRDTNPELFSRIKKLPRKARSTRQLPAEQSGAGLLTYFRQGRLDKFYRVMQGAVDSEELDFLTAAKVLKPADPAETRGTIPPDFYSQLERSKTAFAQATSPAEDDSTVRKGTANDAYISRRLKTPEIRRYPGYTDDDESFIRRVTEALKDGRLPRPTTRKVAEALKQEIEPLRVLGILRRDIPMALLDPTRAQRMHHDAHPREVILSSWLIGSGIDSCGNTEAQQ